MGEQVGLKNRHDGMSELRKFLNRYNLGLNSYSKMIKISRNTLRKYEDDPCGLREETRRKIEVGMMVLERENHIRPKLKDMGDDLSVYRGIRGYHYRNVLQYEKDFKRMFETEMEVICGGK